MACLVPDRKGMGITSLGRDARGFTFSAVIPARVMQPGVSTCGKQNWRIALCCYGMTFALRHRVHFDETLAPPSCTPARVIRGRTLWKGEGRVGSRASPQSQSRSSGRWWRVTEVPVPARKGADSGTRHRPEKCGVDSPSAALMKPLHEPLLPQVKTSVGTAAALADTGWWAHRGCNGIRRLHRWKTPPLSISQERADDPAPAPTLSTDH